MLLLCGWQSFVFSDSICENILIGFLGWGVSWDFTIGVFDVEVGKVVCSFEDLFDCFM